MYRISVFASLFLLLAACGKDLAPADDGGKQKNPPVDGERLTHAENDDGSITSIVDATDVASYVFVDLDEGAEVQEADGTWELAIQRMNIIGNGAAGVLVAWADGTDMGAVPAEAEFRADPEDRDLALAEGVFQTTDPDDPTGAGAWYVYDLANHSLTPRERVYFIKSDEGALFAMIILDYYDDAGTSGYLKFRWAEVPQ